MPPSDATKNNTVIVVEDHPIYRDGIVSSLKLYQDLDLIDAVPDGGEGLKALRQHTPDIAIMDVNLPTINGLQIVRQIRSENIPTRVIVLTGHHDREQTLHVIKSGAQAYASKDIPPTQLITMIRQVLQGLYVINGEVMSSTQARNWVASEIGDMSTQIVEDGNEYYTPLSTREMQILTCVAHGKSNKEIAQELKISQQTVKNHMTSILRKLNVEDRTQAAVTAIRHGWVRVND